MKTIQFLFLFIYLFMFLSCDTKNKNNTETSIKFNKITHDFGKYKWKRGIEKKVFFKYQNTEDIPLIINDIKTSCGCTVPIWNKKPVLPNKTDSIEVIYDSRELGFFNKTITVFFNGKKASQQLTIKGEVIFP